jgi:hypothetical protein
MASTRTIDTSRLTDAAKAKLAKNLCILPDCNRQSASRGPCQMCRLEQRAEISIGKTTEQKLINRGKLLPARKAGRNPKAVK